MPKRFFQVLRRGGLLLASASLFLCTPLTASAQDANPQDVDALKAAEASPKKEPQAKDGAAIDFTKMAPLVVEVTDNEGKPIADASLFPYAMQAAEDANGHGYWNDNIIGPPKMATTDATGRATIHYPVNIGSATRPLTTGLVSFSVEHSDYVGQTVHFDLGPEVAKVQMKPGCEIQLSAIDANGKPVRDFGVIVAGQLAPAYWTDDNQGGRRTRAASDGTWQTMLVKAQADGPTLFSGVLPLRVRPEQDVKIRNVKLSPGTAINGRLSDNVPRPVTKGIVIVVCAPKPAGDSYAVENPSLVWHDSVAIDEDGSFEIPSVPRGGEMQIIVTCDGWLSKTILPPPPKDANAQGREFPITQIQGQIIQLDKDAERMDVTIEMEPTGTIELTVLDPEGKPLPEGEVSSWPNQRHWKGGSTLLGRHYRTMTMIEKQLLPPKDRQPMRFRQSLDLPYIGKLVEGKVTLKGLPIGLSELLVLRHPKYVFKGGEQGEVSFKLESPEPKSMTLRAVLPKENQNQLPEDPNEPKEPNDN